MFSFHSVLILLGVLVPLFSPWLECALPGERVFFIHGYALYKSQFAIPSCHSPTTSCLLWNALLEWLFGEHSVLWEKLLMAVLPEVAVSPPIASLLREPLVVFCGQASHLPCLSDLPTRVQSGPSAEKPRGLRSLKCYSHTAYWCLLSQPSSSAWLWNCDERLLVPVLWNVHVHILLMDHWPYVWWSRGLAKGKWRKGTFENKSIKQN